MPPCDAIAFIAVMNDTIKLSLAANEDFAERFDKMNWAFAARVNDTFAAAGSLKKIGEEE